MFSSTELEQANHGDALSPDCYDDEIPFEEMLADFGESFVSCFRQQVAQCPPYIRPLDLVDVFASTGIFLFRGVVERVQGTHAFVSSAPSEQGQRVAVSACRHASAGPLPRSLSEWETAHGL